MIRYWYAWNPRHPIRSLAPKYEFGGSLAWLNGHRRP